MLWRRSLANYIDDLTSASVGLGRRFGYDLTLYTWLTDAGESTIQFLYLAQTPNNLFQSSGITFRQPALYASIFRNLVHRLMHLPISPLLRHSLALSWSKRKEHIEQTPFTALPRLCPSAPPPTSTSRGIDPP